MGGHQLHHADCTDTAFRVLIERGFLKALRHHKQVIHFVLGSVFLKESSGLLEFLQLGRGDRVLQHLGALPVALDHAISEQSSLFVRLHEFVHNGQKFGTVFPHGPGELTGVVDDNVGIGLDVGVKRRPEFRQIGVGDHDRHEPGIHHLQQVFIFQIFGRGPQLHRRFTTALELCVEGFEMFPGARAFADEDFLAGQVIQRVEFRRIGAGHRDLLHARDKWIRKIDNLLPIGCDGERAHGKIASAGSEPGNSWSRETGINTT